MNELEKCRLEIDKIDAEMARLFEERMRVAASVAAYKREHALPICDEGRESAMLASRLSLVGDEVKPYYADFLKDVMKTSRRYQSVLLEGMRVAYSGVEGAFGYMAARRAFPEATLVSYPDFESAYRAVEAGECESAVLPIENSSAGDVGVVMDLMFSGSLYANRIVELAVEQNLLGVKGASLADIKTVVSHPQALSQCEAYIRANGFETVSYSNTALAAEYVAAKGDKSVAAIASSDAAAIFGLVPLATGINEARGNTTRFAVLSAAQSIPAPESRDENEHFILLFTTRNEAGALAKALNIVGAHDFNMRNLRSRPMKELLWNYYFFVEAEGNIGTVSGQDMLRELSAVCARLKLGGTYR